MNGNLHFFFSVLCLYVKNYSFVYVTDGYIEYPGMVSLTRIFPFTYPKYHLLSTNYNRKVSYLLQTL
ncbi:unnamed protein product [Gongylonema pulchrum]|uniref:Ovule protein n=1 Tax=Gongylonema pulchrum TaxID=637853 RepID=A0A183E6E4_9BILA|nr:unnamed protein product [Gongylonema pulchrum]